MHGLRREYFSLPTTMKTKTLLLAQCLGVLTFFLSSLSPQVRAAEDARPVEDASKVGEQTVVNPKLPTLWIIGDSTVRNGRGDGANGQWGWGDQISGYFDTSKINVV